MPEIACRFTPQTVRLCTARLSALLAAKPEIEHAVRCVKCSANQLFGPGFPRWFAWSGACATFGRRSASCSIWRWRSTGTRHTQT
eukprot:5187224-Prymnesium_polylepis.2